MPVSYKGVSAIALSAIAFMAVGCAAGGGISTHPHGGRHGPHPAVTVKPGHITGLVHGGQQPITGATVQMWAAGTTTGYGAGAIAVGSPVTTDSNGNFDLNPGGGGSAPCADGQLNYITATGGSSQGAGGTVNSAAALMLALPALCNKVITGGLSIVINEVTTVASVWALQQFMSINPPKHLRRRPAHGKLGLTPPMSSASPTPLLRSPSSSTSQRACRPTAPSPAPSPGTHCSNADLHHHHRPRRQSHLPRRGHPGGLHQYSQQQPRQHLANLLFALLRRQPPTAAAVFPLPTPSRQPMTSLRPPAASPSINTTGYNGATVPAGTSLNTPGAGARAFPLGCEWALQLCHLLRNSNSAISHPGLHPGFVHRAQLPHRLCHRREVERSRQQRPYLRPGDGRNRRG